MVLTPSFAPQNTQNWLADSAIPRTRFVYADVDVLWQSARVLAELGCLRTPDDARLLIESVYGAFREKPPSGIVEASRRAQQEFRMHEGVADLNALSFEAGYQRTETSWLDDAIAATRLGAPTSRIRLVLWEGKQLVPLCQASDPRLAYALSEVSVRSSRISQPHPEDEGQAYRRARLEMPDEGQFVVTIPLEPLGSERWQGRGMGLSGRATAFYYTTDAGLQWKEA